MSTSELKKVALRVSEHNLNGLPPLIQVKDLEDLWHLATHSVQSF